MKYFGTDGIRDRVDGPFLSEMFVTKLGKAIGIWLKQKTSQKSNLHVLIGRDTRASGKVISLNLSKGLADEGIKIFDGGIAPTPAIPRCVVELGLSAGIVITASHNPASDNGIKLFMASGEKLSMDEESAIESIFDGLDDLSDDLPSPSQFLFEARRHYVEAIKKQFAHLNLASLRIVVDCSHGGTFQTTPETLSYLGASVIEIGSNPDGQNINRNQGSEYPEFMTSKVREVGADLGIAHDGDGDRLILCDHEGNVIDGDTVLTILGISFARKGILENNTVVSTIMSNGGLKDALDTVGVSLIRSQVGDRNVFYDMKENRACLGGEASGHFISLIHSPSGDGLLAALLVLEEITQTEKSLTELSNQFTPYPQLKKNLFVKSKPPLESNDTLQNDLQELENALAPSGRLLLRYSGTENKIRLLIETKDLPQAESAMTTLESIVRKHLDVA